LPTRPSSPFFRFGPYESCPKTQELYKHGVRLKVRPQPLRLLNLLLDKPGEVLTREEIRQQLWSAETFVDFEHSLNTAVMVLRGVLNDSAAEPVYIETLPRVGYRFIAEVSVMNEKAAAATEEAGGGDQPVRAAQGSILGTTALETPESESASTVVPATVSERRFRWLWLLPVMAIIFMMASAGFYWKWAGARHGGAGARGRKVLAVLPFRNLTGAPDEDYFSDGLTEEMIGQFGRLDPEHLGVIARTSVMHYKHSDEGLDQIGRELGVQYALEGSVRRNADRVRISAQLIKVADQTRMWSHDYDRQISDLLAVQSEIAEEIGGEIGSTLGVSAREKAGHEGALSAQSIEAYDLYLKALYFWNKRTAEGFARAVDYFQQSIKKDATYARAYAGLADSYTLIGGYSGFPPKDLMEKARSAAQKAVELDDSLAETHTAKALVAQTLDWDWPTAEAEYRRAIALNPNYATAHHWYAEYLALMGRFDEAEKQIEQARQLDPLSLIIATDHGVFLYYARRYDAAIEQLHSVLEMDPAYPRAGMIDEAYVEAGRRAEALAHLEAWEKMPLDTPWAWGQKAYLYGRLGRTAEAHYALDRLLAQNRAREIDPIVVSVAYLGLRDRSHALDWLEKAYQEHSFSLTALKVDPTWDLLRSEPRFQELLRRMRFPG
jgi:TolB-like protein/DNA-binding winged helix-turn-helix (wHTH) protein/Tfp pilus assembly protein PilF